MQHQSTSTAIFFNSHYLYIDDRQKLVFSNIKYSLLSDVVRCTFGWLQSFFSAVMQAKILDCFNSSLITCLTCNLPATTIHSEAIYKQFQNMHYPQMIMIAYIFWMNKMVVEFWLERSQLAANNFNYLQEQKHSKVIICNHQKLLTARNIKGDLISLGTLTVISYQLVLFIQSK